MRSTLSSGIPSATKPLPEESVDEMLKILVDRSSDQHVRLRLDGVLAGRWVDVLRESCDVALNRGARLTLDLGNVLFVDREGGFLLRSLVHRRVGLANASPFVTAQIRRAVP